MRVARPSRVHLAVARASARRYATYRAAAVAGIATNTVFGCVRAFVLLEVWRQRPALAGYDASDAVTYVFIGQSLIAAIALFGGGIELPERIRTGAVAADMCRPVGIQGWWMADDAGRAGVQLLLRGLPPLLLAGLIFHLRVPADPFTMIAVAATLVLGFCVSFGLRYIVALGAFWLLDQRGLEYTYTLVTLFFSGLMLPLAMFPAGLGAVARSLPFCAMVQIPAEVFLGLRTGARLAEALAFQAAWAAVILAAGSLLTRRALRKVVLQGG